MAKRPKVKQIRVDLKSPLGKRKLEKLLAEGWTIMSSQKRSTWQAFPGQTDVTLVKDLN